MADNAAFAKFPNCGGGLAVTADTSRTAPNSANTPTIFTAGADGARVERIRGQAVGATVAAMIRLWAYNPTGPVWYLVEEIPVAPVTPSDTQDSYNFSREAVTQPSKMPKILKPNWQLRASISVTQSGGGVMVYAEGGDF